MILTLNAAAKAAHKSKSAILQQIRSGKLSAYQDPETKEWRIDTSELFRVNQPVQSETGSDAPKEPAKNHQEPLSTTLLERHIEIADRERQTLIETINDLRERLSLSQSENYKLTTMLLTHQPPEQKDNSSKSGSKSWFFVSFSVYIASYAIYQLYKMNFFNL